MAGALHAGGRGQPWLALLLVVYRIGMGAAFSPVLAQALVHVPSSQAADASGLLITAMQLSQVVGVAVFGGLFLSLAARQQAHARLRGRVLHGHAVAGSAHPARGRVRHAPGPHRAARRDALRRGTEFTCPEAGKRGTTARPVVRKGLIGVPPRRGLSSQ